MNKYALIDACKKGCEDAVRKMLFSKVDTNVIDDEGYTALIWACKMKMNEDVIEKMLDSSSVINVVDKNNGYNALMWACKNRMYRVFRRLWNMGSDMCEGMLWQLCHDGVFCDNDLVKSELEDIIVLMVSGYDYYDYDVRELFLERDGKSPLFLACRNGMVRAALKIMEGIREWCIDGFVGGWDEVLLECCRGGVKMEEVGMVVVEMGGRDDGKGNCLCLAIKKRMEKLALLLLSCEYAEFDQKALVWASELGMYDVVFRIVSISWERLLNVKSTPVLLNTTSLNDFN